MINQIWMNYATPLVKIRNKILKTDNIQTNHYPDPNQISAITTTHHFWAIPGLTQADNVKPSQKKC